MNVKILGTGCPKCDLLERKVRDLAYRENLALEIEKISDIVDIMSYGVLMTPALIVEGKIVVKGRVPSDNELRNMLAQSEGG